MRNDKFVQKSMFFSIKIVYIGRKVRLMMMSKVQKVQFKVQILHLTFP